MLSAWDRLEAHMAARKLAAAAELIRRRPEPGCGSQGLARMPTAYEEFTADELAQTLAESRGRADGMLTLALALETRLPARRRRCGMGRSLGTRPRPSLGPPPCWIPARPGRPKRWCWAGPGG